MCLGCLFRGSDGVHHRVGILAERSFVLLGIHESDGNHLFPFEEHAHGGIDRFGAEARVVRYRFYQKAVFEHFTFYLDVRVLGLHLFGK